MKKVAGEKRVKTAFGRHEERSSSRMQRVEYTIPVVMLHWLLLFLLFLFLQQHGTEGALVGRRHRSLSSGGSNSSILPVAAAPGSSKFNGYYIRGQPVPLLEPSRSTITLRLPGKSPDRPGCEALGCASSQSNAVNRSSSSSKDPGDQVSSSRRSLLGMHLQVGHTIGGVAEGSSRASSNFRRTHIGFFVHGCGGWAQKRWAIVMMGAFVSVTGLVIALMVCAHGTKEAAADFLESVPSLPPRFSYAKLQKATKNFGRKLGDGAFGSVYEGSLPNGSRVAVKMLEKASVQGEKQFRAEVASMGAIRHLNLVRLHGFCSEGSHRLLVYEFMANGSLDSWLFKKKQGEKMLDWEQRLNIALGTARALAYLHEECSDHIIHLDVKPENILLDHQFCPKLSDFGLAKLMDREQSRVVTSMRGTPGYLAPEWLLPHAAVTAKTDVYSFGMVLLELISGRENTNFSLGKEQWYFPAWAYKLMSEGRTMELLDKRLHLDEVEYFHKKDAVNAIHIALLCIQDDPALRPPMSRVVHMLQGHVEPEALNANQTAIQPPRRLLTAFAASMSEIDSKAVTQAQAVRPAVNSRVPPESPKVMESPRVMESPEVMESPRTSIQVVSPVVLDEMEDPSPAAGNRPESLLPPPANMSTRVSKQTRIPGAHAIGTNPKCIPPWPVKGDVILLRGKEGDFVGVVRDIRIQIKKMQMALVHRLSSEARWSVYEEETIWRDWNEAVKTLDFWVVLRWSTIPGRGSEKFPVEWIVR